MVCFPASLAQERRNPIGVTWIELALDFEISTGLVLPRCASICEKSYGSRLLGRGAEWRSSSSSDQNTVKLEHVSKRKRHVSNVWFVPGPVPGVIVISFSARRHVLAIEKRRSKH